MVGVAAAKDSQVVRLFGEGLSIEQDFQLSDSVNLSGTVPKLDLSTTVQGCKTFSDYAAAVHGNGVASFAIVISERDGGEHLVRKAWNALWLFNLLGVACRAPVKALYSMSDGAQPLYSALSPYPISRALDETPTATTAALEWARKYHDNFNELFSDTQYLTALRCYGNAPYFKHPEVQIMLMWSGIEGLLSIDAELNRRLALYAALMMNLPTEKKAQYYETVRSAYAIRSRVVHGSTLRPEKVLEGIQTARSILGDLLARCAELGRIPKPRELDQIAASGSLDPKPA